mmetsp:Transcript_18614/g.38919  ORF Transcript_18614/g.38919 Transcript_18614/m.38919 type:complete len:91 (-) Transcript_18614:86-358(-)
MALGARQGQVSASALSQALNKAVKQAAEPNAPKARSRPHRRHETMPRTTPIIVIWSGCMLKPDRKVAPLLPLHQFLLLDQHGHREGGHQQ